MQKARDRKRNTNEAEKENPCKIIKNTELKQDEKEKKRNQRERKKFSAREKQKIINIKNKNTLTVM